MTGPRWLPAAAVTVFAAALAWLNRGERVAVDVGMFTFYRAPLAIVLLAVFLAGMLAMLLLGLRHDRRVRDELRRHGLLQLQEPVRPAAGASAWGVVREPAPARDDEQTAAYSPDGERPVEYAREDERPVSVGRDDERPVSYAREDDRSVSHGLDDERTIAYPDRDDRTVSYPRGDERPTSYPRLDGDPAT